MGRGEIVVFLTTVPVSAFKTDLPSIIEAFVEQACSIDDLCDDTLQSLSVTDIDQTGGLASIPEEFHRICSRHHR